MLCMYFQTVFTVQRESRTAAERLMIEMTAFVIHLQEFTP